MRKWRVDVVANIYQAEAVNSGGTGAMDGPDRYAGITWATYMGAPVRCGPSSSRSLLLGGGPGVLICFETGV